MKKVLLILSLSLFVMITHSCKKPPIPSPIEDIAGGGSGSGGGSGGGTGEVEVSPYVGTWSYSSIDLKNGTLGIAGQNLGSFEGVGKNIVGSVVITENPNQYTTTVSFTAEVSVFGQGQDIPVEKKTSSGTWTEANGEIVLTDDSGQKIDIISSTSSKIVFAGNFSESFDIQFGSVEANSDVEFTITK
ncbi:MAG: hypothetical protein ACPGYY_10075 [Bacteroidia bacterium]